MPEEDQRRQDARRREEMMANARRAEGVDAQKLIDDFVAEAGRRGLAPQPLRAATYSGAALKTDKQGWYLNARRSLAIGVDGGYYGLVLPDRGLFARLSPARLVAELPPLHVGAHGKDGEGGELSWFLARVLDAGADGPG